MKKRRSKKFISVNVPIITKEAKAYAAECLRDGWVSSAGPFVEKFERAFATYVGMRHGVAVSSGTAALHVALVALNIKKGDEVIVPAFTMMSSIFAVIYTGARPVFVDCEADTFNIDVKQIEKKITRRTKAILGVHLFGHSCEMNEIRRLSKKHGLYVIEDAAEAHGGRYRGRRVGSLGDISAFSFYGNKIITTGEGGMALTNNAAWAVRMRKARDIFHSDRKRFIHDEVGFNYRLANIPAAIGLGQLRRINEFVQRKQKMARRYNAGLKNIPGLRLPVTKSHVRNVYWMYAVLVDRKKFGMSRDELCRRLRKEGIDTRDFFYPPKDQPALRRLYKNIGRFPVTEKIAQSGFYLPSGLAITSSEIDRVCKTVRSIFATWQKFKK